MIFLMFVIDTSGAALLNEIGVSSSICTLYLFDLSVGYRI